MLTLTAHGLCIRPLHPDDAARLADAVAESLATVGQWLPWCDQEFSVASATQWVQACTENLKAGTAYNLGIFDANAIDFLGGIGLTECAPHTNSASIGYWVRQSRQHQKIAARAVRLMAEFGFGTLGLARIDIVIAEQNHASRQVARSVGARFDGIHQDRLLLRGAPTAAAIYSLWPV